MSDVPTFEEANLIVLYDAEGKDSTADAVEVIFKAVTNSVKMPCKFSWFECCPLQKLRFMDADVKMSVAAKKPGEECLERVVNVSLAMELVTDVKLSENEVFIVMDPLVYVNSTGEDIQLCLLTCILYCG